MTTKCVKCNKDLITDNEIYCSGCKAAIKQKIENIQRLDKFKKA